MSKPIDQVYYWDELLTQEDYDSAWFELEQFQWELGGFSDKPFDSVQRMFWFKQLEGAGWLRSVLKRKVEEILKQKITTLRLYANGQSHSQCGWIHRDQELHDKGNFGTLVYFIHPEWKPIYGGHLILIDDTETKVTNSFFPKTNSAVLFNSKINHMGLEPSVYCTDQRISVALKFKLTEPNEPNENILGDFNEEFKLDRPEISYKQDNKNDN
jgi:hypothetical protein